MLASHARPASNLGQFGTTEMTHVVNSGRARRWLVPAWLRMITFHDHARDVDWETLRQDLISDRFHNGRTTAQLKASFENSQHVAMAFEGARCIGNARALSDGVGNAYIVDVWTHSDHRRMGIGREMVAMLTTALPGQHVYLQTDEALEFWMAMGFRHQPHGLSLVVGTYLHDS